jgi:bifunctional polynucleotide phosphatase/kinase
MGNKAKCMKVAKEALAKGSCVVVDNTNPGVDIRAEWIAIAREHKASVRCIVMDTPFDITRHLNLFREATAGVKRIPDVAFHTFKKHLVQPKVGEGFESVDVMPFKVSDDVPNVKTLFTYWT